MTEKKIDQDLAQYKKGSEYSRENTLIKQQYRNRIIKLLHQDGIECKKSSVLDLGMGKGYNVEFFSEKFGDYTVIEGDADIIELFRQNHKNSARLNIINSYFENYHSDQKYDVILMGFILEHVLNPVEIICKYKSLLSDSGRMYIAVPNATSMHRQLGKLAGNLKDLYELSEADTKYGHRRYYSVPSLTKDIVSAGMRVSRVEGLFFKPFTTAQIQSLNLNDDYLNALCELGEQYPELCASILVEAIN